MYRPLPVSPKEFVPKLTRTCDYCQKPYLAESRYLNRGQGRYCSQSCSAVAIGLKNRVIHEPNLECALCGIAFYRQPSHQVKSKSGLFFCCRAHKDEAQRIDGLKEIHPDHYGSTQRYRDIAFRLYPHCCARCGYDKHPEILEVNHKDVDRSNNAAENLEILCPNCHEEFHFTTQTGKWGPRNRGSGVDRTLPLTLAKRNRHPACRPHGHPGAIQGGTSAGMAACRMMLTLWS